MPGIPLFATPNTPNFNVIISAPRLRETLTRRASDQERSDYVLRLVKILGNLSHPLPHSWIVGLFKRFILG